MSEAGASTLRMKLEGEFTIYRASELKCELMAALDGARSLEIDVSAVTEIDCAGIQLLMLAKRVAAQRQQSLRLTCRSEAVTEALTLLDLVPHFGDSIDVPAAPPSR